MKVSINGLRRKIAQDFNRVLKTVNHEFIWGTEFDEDDKENWHKLREDLAFLLLIHDDHGEMDELNPDDLLDIPPD